MDLEESPLIDGILFSDPSCTIPARLTCFKQRLCVEAQQYHFQQSCSFQILRSPSYQIVIEDRKTLQLGQPYALSFQKSEKSQILYHPSQHTLLAIKETLAERMVQRGFHNLYKPFKKLGKGSSAVVYLGERLQDHGKVAIKAFPKEMLLKEAQGSKSLQNQISTMRLLNNRSLMKLFEVFETDNTLYLVLEYLAGGQLSDHCKTHPFSRKEIQKILYDLLIGLRHMHSLDIVHRDLKPQNIIFRNPNTYDAIIADFGLATWVHEKEYIYYRCGTPGFTAPEIIRAKPGDKQSTISDLFSLGAIAYLLTMGRVPFTGSSCKEVLLNNRNCKIDFDNQACRKVDPILLDLIKKLMNPDPKTRITAAQAVEHPFFTEIIQQDECQSPANASFVVGEVTFEGRKCIKDIHGSFHSGKSSHFRKKPTAGEKEQTVPASPNSPLSPASFTSIKSGFFAFEAKQKEAHSAFLENPSQEEQMVAEEVAVQSQ